MICTSTNADGVGGLSSVFAWCLAEQRFGAAVSVSGQGAGAGVDWGRWRGRLLPLMTRSRTRGLARAAARRLGASALRRSVSGADVVHVIGTGWDLLGFAAEAEARRAGAAVTCWPAVHPGTWGDSPLDADLYRRVDAVFVQSDHEAEHLTGLGVSPAKLVRCGCAPSVGPGGDGERFRREHGLGDREVVLFVGTRSATKGYPALREAIVRMRASGRDVRLVTLGRPMSPPMNALPAEAELDLGVADDQTKADAFAACDVFALPSAAESFGIVYVEAWSYGKPVVCGEAPASRELVTRHGGGLCSSHDPAQLAADLCELLDDQVLRATMGAAGRRAVQVEYTNEAVARVHRETWERLLRNKA